jgi:hypothetical protein
MHKGKVEANVKMGYEFGHDPMTMCFKHQKRMKLDHKIKDIKIVFLSCKL